MAGRGNLGFVPDKFVTRRRINLVQAARIFFAGRRMDLLLGGGFICCWAGDHWICCWEADEFVAGRRINLELGGGRICCCAADEFIAGRG